MASSYSPLCRGTYSRWLVRRHCETCGLQTASDGCGRLSKLELSMKDLCTESPTSKMHRKCDKVPNFFAYLHCFAVSFLTATAAQPYTSFTYTIILFRGWILKRSVGLIAQLTDSSHTVSSRSSRTMCIGTSSKVTKSLHASFIHVSIYYVARA